MARRKQLMMFVILGLMLGVGLHAAVALDLYGSLGPGRHQRYVSPLANPLFNETPYITSEVRPIYFHQKIPGDFLTDGGTIDVVALQIRLALTERLGFIATKDGYANIDFDSVLADEDGFANIAFGLKYALLSQPRGEAIVSVGIRYEAPIGNLETSDISLQGGGNGFFDMFITAAKAFGRLGLQGSLGINLAVDQDHDSSMFHFSFRTDYEVLPGLFPLIELHGFTTVDHGDRTDADFEGIDLVNFGSTDSGTVVTFAGGLRYRFNRHLQVGAGYETPVTHRQDIMDWRVYADLVLSY